MKGMCSKRDLFGFSWPHIVRTPCMHVLNVCTLLNDWNENVEMRKCVCLVPGTLQKVHTWKFQTSVVFLCLYRYLMVVKTVWFETPNVPCGTVRGHCSVWCYHTTAMSIHLPQNLDYYRRIMGHALAQMVEALCYKLEGRGLDSRWCHWYFSLT